MFRLGLLMLGSIDVPKASDGVCPVNKASDPSDGVCPVRSVPAASTPEEGICPVAKKADASVCPVMSNGHTSTLLPKMRPRDSLREPLDTPDRRVGASTPQVQIEIMMHIAMMRVNFLQMFDEGSNTRLRKS
jgi:hypothetical protein